MANKPKTRPRRKPMADINVVPYIDVMLVLLVVFMITAPMMTQGVRVELPDAEAPALEMPKDQELVVVAVDAVGRYFLNVGDDASRALPLSKVVSQVSKIARNTSNIPVLVEADERVQYGAVIQVMAALKQAGVNDVGLVTDPVSVDAGSAADSAKER